MTDAPKSFDWVAARANCTARDLFADLTKVVQKDVERAREIVSTQIHFRDGPAQGTFKVSLTERESGPELDWRRFELIRQQIVVDRPDGIGEPKRILHATACLVSGRDCLLEVTNHEVTNHSEPIRLWQFSRLALEDLFFRGR